MKQKSTVAPLNSKLTIPKAEHITNNVSDIEAIRSPCQRMLIQFEDDSVEFVSRSQSISSFINSDM
jgi:hypothetical protein